MIGTGVIASDSKSPSASSDHRFEVNGILGFGEIQDTEPIDETVTLDSSLLETQFQKLYEDTELVVDNGNCCDEETLNQELDGVDEVVNDSEDEDGGTKSLQELSLKTTDILLESDGSNDHECQQKGNQESKCDTVTCLQDSSRINDNSQGRELDFLNSQEPGESTQAEAIGFVDNLLMGIDLNLSPVDIPETSWRMKSPPFSGAKGPQSLVKRIKTTSPTKKMRVFDWDSDQCDVSRSSDPQKSPDSRANIREDPGVKKGSLFLCENIKVSTHPMEQGLSHGITFTSQMDDAKLQDKLLEEQSEHEEDFIDVGINTQIAAEAMSDLLYAHCSKEDACEPNPIPERISELRDQVSPNIPQKQRNSRKKRNFSKIERNGTNVSDITCLLNLNELKHPRAKRSRLMQKHHVQPRKCWGVSSVKDRSKTNTLSSGLRVSFNGTREASSCQSGVNDLDVANHASLRKTHGRSRESSCNKDKSRPSLELKRLGEPGKVDYESRRRRNLTHVRVLFSHNLDDETINQQTKIMVRLGISPAISSTDSTHFVADRFARTRNMLEAIALGKPVVTPLWLESCGEARCLIDEKSYILRDNKKEKEIGFCMLTSLSRAKQRPLLKGFKVCITPNIKPSRDMIVDLVKLTQGQVVEISKIDRNLPDDLLILSCEEDRNFCLPFINQGAVIYTSELLLNGFVIQKLEYARHGLCLIADKRNQRNTKFTTRSSFMSAY